MAARLVVLAMLLIVATAKAQAGFAPQEQDSARYAELRSRIAAGDTTVDFTELRVIAARRPSPLGIGSSPAEHLALARDAPDSLVARAHVDSVIWLYFGHVRAHVDAKRIFEERHDTTRSLSEAAIVRGFIASIGANGGLTATTAMPVVSIDEEYAYLAAHHVHREMQALSKCGTGKCDVLTGVEESTGQIVTYYFLLTWQ